MRHLAVALLAIFAASCAPDQRTPIGPANEPQVGRATPGTPEHGLFRPEQVNWKDGPPSLPPGAKFAVLEGDPSKEGYFAMRLKLPSGYKIPPHTHPNVERVTVISGTFHLGMSDTFDEAAAHALPAGSYTFMQPGMKHFAWAEGETEVQITTIGPWKINYLNPADDPRRR
jgi:quercetin dioxygenase-like cupin family protein